EFLVLIGTYTRYAAAAVIATVALVLSAVYILWLYQRVMGGRTDEGNRDVHDLRPREVVAVAPLLVLLLVLGLYPKPILDVIDPAVGATLASVHSPDPEPTVPGGVPAEAQGRGGPGAGAPGEEGGHP